MLILLAFVVLFVCFFRSFFFFNDTATTEIYTLSLHDALPIFLLIQRVWSRQRLCFRSLLGCWRRLSLRSEEHTSELQSRLHLVCRLRLEKNKCGIRRLGMTCEITVYVLHGYIDSEL